jgi:hypothetical protein
MLFALDYGGREHGRTALHTAAENNDVPFIKEWIAKGKRLDQGLSYGGNIEARGTRGVTALMLAAKRGNEEAATALILGGANIYLEDDESDSQILGDTNRTALDYAFQSVDLRTAKMLMDRWGRRPFTRLGYADAAVAIANLCPDDRPDSRRSVGYEEANAVATLALDQLATAKEAEFAVTSTSLSPKCLEQVTYLLDRHMAPSTPMLVVAVLKGTPALIEQLVRSGAEVNATGSSWSFVGVTTPLIAATYAARLDVVKMLLDNGADVNFQDIEGRTALHYAVNQHWSSNELYLKADMDVIEMLVVHGARTDIPNKSGRTALDFFNTPYNHDLGGMRNRLIAAFKLPPDKFPPEKVLCTPARRAGAAQNPTPVPEYLLQVNRPGNPYGVMPAPPCK